MVHVPVRHALPLDLSRHAANTGEAHAMQLQVCLDGWLLACGAQFIVLRLS